MLYEVKVARADVYDGPRPPRKVIGHLVRGHRITRTGYANGYIRYGDNGWIANGDCKLVANPTPATPAPVQPTALDLKAHLPIRIGNALRYLRFGRTESSVRSQLVSVSIFGRNTAMHKKVAPKFTAWVTLTRRYEAAHGLKAYAPKSVECFCWRTIRGSSSRSLHSWAIAVDIDADSNPQGGHKTNIPDYVRVCARACGVTPGYDFKSNPDPMHFEYAG